MKNCIIAIILTFVGLQSHAQAGFGFTVTNDLYQWYQNPSDNTGQSSAAGNAILNLGVGPKIWIGGEDFSLSAEAQAVWGMTSFSAGDYKGLGSMAFPLMAKLNFGGMSGLDKEGRFGFTVGGGLQYTRTEWYYVKESFRDAGGDRDYFKTYVVQAGYGFGMSGISANVYVRYGWTPDSDANILNVGIQYDINIPKFRQISDPESELD